MRVTALVLAAGRGRRMGQDKALLDLRGRAAVQRVVDACVEGGADRVTVVRRAGDPRLPDDVRARAEVARAPCTREMIETLQWALRREPPPPSAFLVFPVDYALAGGAAVAAVLERLRSGAAPICLPLFEGRPGHPIGLAGRLAPEVSAASTLRSVVARDPARVAVAPVDSPWVRRDLDTPDDLADALAWLGREGGSP